ncbi:MAG: hypothetical protein COV52_07845 [Gammaproteobacteria bacterium CG11_big_fil_rev_8_21_14_0_20_46_22]|nr:MAG: hypothetical protein COW05_03925 [Gammaproteobacteria bacterium CG12_big_fil_rev_8_21_14_0_65_46_12]PIR10669.1 MAG: hypothetical protein COV52_07845 [Gammaproteobacteria bacterium CG11_big_fil_rev_8_21_14_0_20_46_22]
MSLRANDSERGNLARDRRGDYIFSTCRSCTQPFTNGEDAGNASLPDKLCTKRGSSSAILKLGDSLRIIQEKRYSMNERINRWAVIFISKPMFAKSNLSTSEIKILLFETGHIK